jgi:hypothetical protein
MTLVEALKVSRIAVLKIEGDVYYSTHTACYKERNGESVRLNNLGKIGTNKNWHPMGHSPTTVNRKT